MSPEQKYQAEPQTRFQAETARLAAVQHQKIRPRWRRHPELNLLVGTLLVTLAIAMHSGLPLPLATLFLFLGVFGAMENSIHHDENRGPGGVWS